MREMVFSEADEDEVVFIVALEDGEGSSPSPGDRLRPGNIVLRLPLLCEPAMMVRLRDGLGSAFPDGYFDKQWQSIAERLSEHVQNGRT